MPEVSMPPILRGTQEEKLLSVRAYLFRLADELNGALDSINAGNIQLEKTLSIKADAAKTEEERRSIRTQAAALKDLILNTQNTLTEYRSSVDQELAAIQSGYVAVSDFGTYQEATDSRITATESGLTQAIEYYNSVSSSVSSLETTVGANAESAREGIAGLQARADGLADQNAATAESVAGLSSDLRTFETHVSGMIRSGIVDYDGVIPIVGIAIGQEITETAETETVDGVTYHVLDKGSYSSVFTATKLAFYSNNLMVAYIDSQEKNGALMIATAKITGELDIGNWAWTHGAAGLTLKWIGG